MPRADARCFACDTIVTDETLRHRYCQEGYPNIPIGPVCPSCVSNVRICSGCQHPFIDGSGDIEFLGNGDWFCTSCAPNLVDCSNCGARTTELMEINGEEVCHICYRTKYKKCPVCEGHKRKDTFVNGDLERAMYPTIFVDHQEMCRDCYDEKAGPLTAESVRPCNRCNLIYTTGTETHAGYCEQCVRSLIECEVCGNHHHQVHSRHNDEGDSVVHMCSACEGSLFRCDCSRYSTHPVEVRGIFTSKKSCRRCSNEQLNSTLRECPECLRFVQFTGDHCGECHNLYHVRECSECGRGTDKDGNCRVCSNTIIYNYTYKPHLRYWYTDRDLKSREKLFVGIENEITFSSRKKMEKALRELYSSYDPNILLAKSDASIHDYGFEIVTQPMTLDIFHQFDLNGMFWNNMVDDASCGMHVHVARDAFVSDLHIFKVVKFIHDNAPFINHIVGRDYNGFNEKLRKKASATVLDAKRGSASRGMRVNLSNGKTIEFRMFAGCVSEFKMRYRVEFLHALIKWSKRCPINRDKPEDLMHFVAKNSKDYPTIYKFLDQRCTQFIGGVV